jgi:acetolactate synthase-1/2/3 large subunit
MEQDGNAYLIETLKKWGVELFTGVNGGGIIHLTKLLSPYSTLEQSGDGILRYLTMVEYVSGFIPLGYFLASGKMAACLVTTGAAIKLAACGLSDAKFHNIPAIYLFALNPTFTLGNSPLQDVSMHGMHIAAQVQAELGDGFFLIDAINTLEKKLQSAYEVLISSRPVAIAFHPDILCQPVTLQHELHVRNKESSDVKGLDFLIEQLKVTDKERRIVLYVCSEAARYPKIKHLTTQLAERLQAPTVWSVNGANAVDHDNPLGYGYIALGGNDRALELWNSLGEKDGVIALGFDTGEYSLNLNPIPAGTVWHLTQWHNAYGQIDGSFQHRVAHQYIRILGDISESITYILKHLPESVSFPKTHSYTHLNTRTPKKTGRKGCVDLIDFYQALYKLWQPNSIGFDDVCISYRDRQYITQRPHPYIDFHTTHDGSAMGSAFGLGIGAKLACPERHIFIFSGDGCWRLYGGGCAEAAQFDIRLFILNNQSYALVEQGLKIILPHFDAESRHSRLVSIDFLAAAESCGWIGKRLESDLSNLEEIMHDCYSKKGRSMLIEVPVDPNQVVGSNPRYENLVFESYL